MTLRALKKQEKRAVKTLIRKHGFSRSDFHPSDGSEAMDAPNNLAKRHNRHGFIDPGPMNGTPLVWERTSYEYDEWDARFPSDVLADLEFDWSGAMDEFLAGVASEETQEKQL